MTVICNGVFDILHIGHINMLIHARELAGEHGKLIVAIDEDEKVMADKGLDRPIFSSMERATALIDLRYQGKNMINEVVSFHSSLELEMLIKRIRPDVIVKGSDWEGKTVIGSDVARVVFYPRINYSTTEILRRCRK